MSIENVAVIGAIVSAVVSMISTVFAFRSINAHQKTRTELVRKQLQELISAYARVRATLPSSSDRTLQMEVIADQMRALIVNTDADLDRLANSPEPGERLAGVLALQVRPRPEYLQWLATRFESDQPFIAYQAGLALLAAVHSVEEKDRPRVKTMLEKALMSLGPEKQHTDRWRVLKQALRQLS